MRLLVRYIICLGLAQRTTKAAAQSADATAGGVSPLKHFATRSLQEPQHTGFVITGAETVNYLMMNGSTDTGGPTEIEWGRCHDMFELIAANSRVDERRFYSAAVPQGVPVHYSAAVPQGVFHDYSATEPQGVRDNSMGHLSIYSATWPQGVGKTDDEHDHRGNHMDRGQRMRTSL